MFIVYVDDNWAVMDDTARRTLGSFDTIQEAEAACRALVDRSLDEQFEPGITEGVLLAAYKLTGEDPFIYSSAGETEKFSAWDYATARARELCAGI